MLDELMRWKKAGWGRWEKYIEVRQMKILAVKDLGRTKICWCSKQNTIRIKYLKLFVFCLVEDNCERSWKKNKVSRGEAVSARTTIISALFSSIVCEKLSFLTFCPLIKSLQNLFHSEVIEWIPEMFVYNTRLSSLIFTGYWKF